MRIISIVFCVIGIFILTCTASFSELIKFGIIRFEWNAHPMLFELFYPLPSELTKDFLQQKIGHISAFFILTLLLQARFRSNLLILFLTILFSCLTEFLQLYFTRDGRVFDIGFDVIGVLLALGVGSLFTIHRSKQMNL